MYDVTKCAAQEAVIDPGVAFQAFFEKRARYPRFKKKGGARDSFCAANEAGTFCLEGRRIRLPRIGWVRMREALRFSGTPKRVTVLREADRWFGSVLVEIDDIGPVAHPGRSVGVDLGVKTLAVLSTGEAIAGPKPHRRLLAALRRRSQVLSRKRRGLGEPQEGTGAPFPSACPHRQYPPGRDAQGDDAAGEGLETHRDRGPHCARHGVQPPVRPLDHGWWLSRVPPPAGIRGGDVRYDGGPGGPLVSLEQDLFLARGSVNAGLALSQRVFRCDECAMEIDRDLNAARNLEGLAASSAVSACGEACSGATAARSRVGTGRVKQAPVKQEPNGSVPLDLDPGGQAAQLQAETASHAQVSESGSIGKASGRRVPDPSGLLGGPGV